MKKNNVLMALSAMAVLSFGSCEKEAKLVPGSGPAEKASEQGLKNKVYDAGVKAINNYPANQETNVGYFRIYYNSPPALQTPAYYNYFGGDMSSTVKCYGYAINPSTGIAAEAYSYTIGGYPILDYNGSIVIIMNDPVNVFTPVIEEIEIDPSTLKTYALARAGNSIRLYSIDETTGIATLITYSTNNVIFNNPLGNNYKSGAICFVPNDLVTIPTPGYRLVFAAESGVYASLGITFWEFTISGGALTNLGSYNRTCNVGVPSGTGKINIAYGDGTFYFGRDGGDLYSVSNMATGTTVPPTPASNCAMTSAFTGVGLSYDYGYWKNF